MVVGRAKEGVAGGFRVRGKVEGAEEEKLGVSFSIGSVDDLQAFVDTQRRQSHAGRECLHERGGHEGISLAGSLENLVASLSLPHEHTHEVGSQESSSSRPRTSFAGAMDSNTGVDGPIAAFNPVPSSGARGADSVSRKKTTLHNVAHQSILMSRLHADTQRSPSPVQMARSTGGLRDTSTRSLSTGHSHRFLNAKIVPETYVRDDGGNGGLPRSRGSSLREMRKMSSRNLTEDRKPIARRPRDTLKKLNTRPSADSEVDGAHLIAAQVASGEFGRMRSQGRIAAVGNYAVISAAQKELDRPQAARCCVLQPNGEFRRKWDIIMIFLLVYLTIFTPFQIAFLSHWTMLNIETWWFIFFVDRCVDVYFIADIVLNFRTAIMVSKHKTYFNGHTVAMTYLKTWFTVDVLSSIPFEVIEFMFLMANPDGFRENQFFGNESSIWFKINKIIRLFRLAKLLKVVRASRVLARWERAIVMKIRYGLVRLVLFLIIVIAVVHWLGCGLGFLLVVQEEEEDGSASFALLFATRNTLSCSFPAHPGATPSLPQRPANALI